MKSFVLIIALVIAGCSEPAPRADNAHASWSNVRIGSIYETRSVTRLQKPFVHETEITTRQTLLARTGTEASIRLVINEGSATTAHDIHVPLRDDKLTPPHDGRTITMAKETCAVPAGTFDCMRTTVEIQQGDLTRSTSTWTAQTVPVPIKTVVMNENMTITTELTRIEKTN